MGKFVEGLQHVGSALATVRRHAVNDVPAVVKGVEVGLITTAIIVRPEVGVGATVVVFVAEGMAAHRRKVKAGHIPDSRQTS